MTQKKQSLIEFPCSFPIKIMGDKHPDFPAKVLETVQQHAPDAEHGHMTLRDSYRKLRLEVHHRQLNDTGNHAPLRDWQALREQVIAIWQDVFQENPPASGEKSA